MDRMKDLNFSLPTLRFTYVLGDHPIFHILTIVISCYFCLLFSLYKSSKTGRTVFEMLALSTTRLCDDPIL